MTVELFLLDRPIDLSTQSAHDETVWVLHKDPESDPSEQFLAGHQRLCKQKDLLPTIGRHKRTHLSAYKNFMKLFVQSRDQMPSHSELIPALTPTIAAGAGQAQMEPSSVPSVTAHNTLEQRDFPEQTPPVDRTAISPQAHIRMPSDTAFQMENEGATQKPDPRQSVTL